MKRKPKAILAEMMEVLDKLGVPDDPDPVNRLRRLTGAWVGLTFQATKLDALAKDMKRAASLEDCLPKKAKGKDAAAEALGGRY